LRQTVDEWILSSAQIEANGMHYPLVRASASRGVDIPFEVAVHDGEEDLEEQVDGIYQHRQKV
jgi:hypothetical protein